MLGVDTFGPWPRSWPLNRKSELNLPRWRGADCPGRGRGGNELQQKQIEQAGAAYGALAGMPGEWKWLR